MKGYENVSRTYLIRRMPMIIRVDGKAFHSFTKGFEKPWDNDLVNAMTEAAKDLMEHIQGAKIAYIQSDEISILVTDYDNLETQAWFGKNIQKIASVSASIATMAFNLEMTEQDLSPTACFDSRVFIIPHTDINNYFIWRQRDAIRNSISGLGQKYFSHKQLHKKNAKLIKEMLLSEKNVNWDDCKNWQKYGWCVKRRTIQTKENTVRTIIEPDWNIPDFTHNRYYIEDFVYLQI